MFQRSAPTLLAYGGTYAKNADMKIENILPFTFPFGIGGPKMVQRVKISLELCIQVYMRLSLEQFMEGPTILVMNHIYNRQLSYKTGVMTCRSTVDGVPLGEKLSTLSTEDFEQIIDIQACTYKYDIQITQASGEVDTWISGLFTVTDDITCKSNLRKITRQYYL